MTKSELVGAAYLKLTGGYPNTDSTTWWEDVDLLIAPAINYVMSADYFISKRDEGEEKIIQPLFLQSFKLPVTVDPITKKHKSKLPKRPMAWPKNRAVPFVGTSFDNQFVPVEQSGGAMQKYFSGLKKEQTSYELEGMDITYFNLPPLLRSGNVLVKMVVSASDLNDDDEILLPDGAEIQVINLMVDFFIGQKQLPKDYYNTNKEPNTQA